MLETFLIFYIILYFKKYTTDFKFSKIMLQPPYSKSWLRRLEVIYCSEETPTGGAAILHEKDLSMIFEYNAY
jgi:hypothetical protein